VGLGLSITRHLVDLLRGNIDVENVQGEGATFIVRLPCAAIAAEPRRPAIAVPPPAA
jgi:signal transduction histidine kinase